VGPLGGRDLDPGHDHLVRPGLPDRLDRSRDRVVVRDGERGADPATPREGVLDPHQPVRVGRVDVHVHGRVPLVLERPEVGRTEPDPAVRGELSLHHALMWGGRH